MCEAATIIAAATVASSVISTGAMIYGQQVQEKAAKQAARANADAAAAEAATQQELAKQEIAKGIADKSRQQRQAARAMGELRAKMGASGFEMDSGSNLDLLAESAGEHAYDSAVISSNAEGAAWQRQLAAVSAANQKEFADWQYRNASSGRAAQYIGAAGSLLGGIGSGVGQYYYINQYKK